MNTSTCLPTFRHYDLPCSEIGTQETYEQFRLSLQCILNNIVKLNMTASLFTEHSHVRLNLVKHLGSEMLKLDKGSYFFLRYKTKNKQHLNTQQY